MLFHALLSITFNPDAILWSIVNSCNQYIFIKSRKTRLIIFICINILDTISSSSQPFFILKYFPSPLLLYPPFFVENTERIFTNKGLFGLSTFGQLSHFWPLPVLFAIPSFPSIFLLFFLSSSFSVLFLPFHYLTNSQVVYWFTHDQYRRS